MLGHRSDFHRRAGIIGSLPYTVLQEGRVIYGEDIESGSVKPMNIDQTDPAAQRAEARRWIAIADQDLRAVAICLHAEPPAMETAACHCQQAAEKLLKALLVAAARPTRKTHDLDELAGEVAEVHPDWALLADNCRTLGLCIPLSNRIKRCGAATANRDRDQAG